MFLLKRKGNHRLQLTRTVSEPGRYQVDLYLFTPHEDSLTAWTLSEQQFLFTSIEHRFSLLGLPEQDRIGKSNQAFALLSPHYEITFGSWLFQYRASMERLRQQIDSSGLSVDLIKRALRLSRNFAQRLRNSSPAKSSQQRYYRLADIYYSWHTEQFLLECLAMEGFDELGEEIRESVIEFLEREYQHRQEHEYKSSFKGNATRVWNRMGLYHRLLEYPVLLRPKVIELGDGTRKMVKAVSTTLIMAVFTYILFNTRTISEQLSLSLLFGIALIYAVRDLLRDDMITAITRWLRKGKPRWKIRLLTPYTNKPFAGKRVWLDYRKRADLPKQVKESSGKWVTNEAQQIVCYRSVTYFDHSALEKSHLQERLSLDCEALCEMIQPTTNKLYAWSDKDDFSSEIKAHPIEKQHDYDLLLVYSQTGQEHQSAQRWSLRLSSNGIVECEQKKANWPKPEGEEKELEKKKKAKEKNKEKAESSN
ncbi:hypothetical protein [Marinobacter sp. S0848L]|uniref:hypothetical protein n=1 Tax=Marinobacter sp. S0848L TaxID=2926423 RepID=UPI001FF1A22B|nr:hypothetical protein [Marinobacter sp. S0848L]